MTIALTSTGAELVRCGPGDFGCTSQRVATLFAVFGVPAVTGLVVAARSAATRRYAQYYRIFVMGAPRLTLRILAGVESLVAACAGILFGVPVGTLTACLFSKSGIWTALLFSLGGSLLSASIVVFVTVLGMRLREPRALAIIRARREDSSWMPVACWCVAVVVLAILARIAAHFESFSTLRSSVWLAASIAATLLLPLIVPKLVRLVGNSLGDIRRPLALRLAARQMSYRSNSFTIAGQVFAAAVAVAVAAQFVWIAVASTPAVDRILVAQSTGPNIQIFASDRFDMLARELDEIRAVEASAPFVVGTCSDGDCGVLVAPCDILAEIATLGTECVDGYLYSSSRGDADSLKGAELWLGAQGDIHSEIATSAISDFTDLASFFSDFPINVLATPGAVGPFDVPTDSHMIALVLPGVLADDVVLKIDSVRVDLVSGLNVASLDAVFSQRNAIYLVALIAILTACVGLVAISFDSVLRRREISIQWERVGVPRVLSTQSYVIGQMLTGVLAVTLGCVTGAAISWDLGYTSLVENAPILRMGSAIIIGSLGVFIIVMNAIMVQVGVRLGEQRHQTRRHSLSIDGVSG